ncbi:MAG: restriction endonuclease subunit S [Planctomycetes bacterium]|nr:restriction endonuclease subunit S [Planctomycetota bacterium]
MSEESLGDLATLSVGIARSRKSDAGGATEHPVVNVRDLEDGQVRSLGDLDRVALTERQEKVADRYRVQAGDVLVSCRGTVTKVGLVTEDTAGALVSSNIILIRPGERLDPRVLFCLLRSPLGRRSLEGIATGSTIKAINTKNLAKLTMPVASVEAQRAFGDLVALAEEQYWLGLEVARDRRLLAHSTVLARLNGEG